MSTPVITGVDGVAAAGRQPAYVIQDSVLTSITSTTKSIPLSAVTGGEKIDCFYDFGGLELSREARTKERQRACEKAVKTVKIGESINGTVSIVSDQQAGADAEINRAYSALPEGEDVWIFIAHGWDSQQAPTSATVGDLWHVTVTQVDRIISPSAEDELKAQATLAGDMFVPNVTLSA